MARPGKDKPRRVKRFDAASDGNGRALMSTVPEAGTAQGRAIRPGAPDAPDDRDLEAAQKYFAKAKSDNTRLAYTRHWAEFAEYCRWRRRRPLPADAKAVVGYLSYVADAGASPPTLRQKLAAITWVHKMKKLPPPSTFVEVVTLMEGVVRDKAHRPHKGKPLMRDELRKLVQAVDAPHPADVRDRALLIVGYFGLLRRSELVAIEVSHVKFAPGDADMTITLPQSKTDQAKKGAALPYPRLDAASADVCPVRAMRAWLDVLRDNFGVTKGYVFRKIDQWGNLGKEALTGQVVNLLVKRLAGAAGIDPEAISAHSALRAGMATQLDADRVPFRLIKDAGRWKSDAVASGYIRRGEAELRDALKRAGERRPSL